MRLILFLLSFSLFYSCKIETKSEAQKTIDETQKFIDSVKVAKKVDSMVKNTLRNAYFDTVGISEAPVKVISAKIVREEYSSYRNVRLSWKNVSNKKIAGVKFKWYGVDAFGEPADMGSGFDGLGGGFTDEPLSPGKSDYGKWSVLSRDAKKILSAWPYEVAFEDGTIWKQKQ